MAQTEFTVNHPLAVKIWSNRLAVEAFRQTYVGRFIGKGTSSIIMEKTDLKKSAGDKITCGLKVQLQGDGVGGDATLEGNEEALSFYDDSLNINQLRHAARTKGKMSNQRVPYNMRNEMKESLGEWCARRMDEAFFNQICGNTAQTNLLRTGNNAPIAPSSNRIFRAGNQANDESLTSSDTFDLSYVDIARQKAETASTENNTGPVVRPIRYMGGDYYVMFLHDYQVHDLRTNTAAGQWQDIQKAAMQGGDVERNPIFSGALGVYNGVVLHKASRITQGVNSSSNVAVANTRRAVLCGAQAAIMAFGGDNGPTRYTWKEENFDYDNQLGVAAGMIFGLKKAKYIPSDDSTTNAEDFGTIVCSTYAAAATPT